MKKLVGLLVAILIMLGAVTGANATTIFFDDFNRPNSKTVGDWTEIEKDDWGVGVWNEQLYLEKDKHHGHSGIDAAAILTTSMTGYENIYLSFDWNAPENTENNDKLFVQYNLNETVWVELWEHNLGGSNYVSELLSINAIDDGASVQIRFHTVVDKNDEWAYIDNVLLSGDVIVPISIVPVPEPATMLLFGIGLMGIAGIIRRKK